MMFAPLKIRKKTISLLLIFTFLLGLAAFTAQGRQKLTVAEEMLLTVVAPVQGVFQRLTRTVESTFTTIREYRVLLEENAALREELAAAATLEARLLELRQENHRLREMLAFKERTEYSLISAEVIGRDSSSWFQTMTINRGSYHGVEKKMAVVTSDGLVGSILSVSHLSSQVLLLTDSRPQVSALVQRSRDPGEVEVGLVENAPGIPGYLKMINLPREANIQPGDRIISSGRGGVFPKGLVIGYVLETGEDEYGLLQYALLRPAANFNRLEEVFVVVPDSGQAEE
jgi:rod shape-determining protein MreC